MLLLLRLLLLPFLIIYLRARAGSSKRNAEQEHDASPTKKASRRTLESTFTPKMRKRSFSVKRFKRKKSEGKILPLKEAVVVQAVQELRSRREQLEQASPPMTRQSLTGTPRLRNSFKEFKGGQEVTKEVQQGQLNNTAETHFNSVLEEDYSELKAQYEEVRKE